MALLLKFVNHYLFLTFFYSKLNNALNDIIAEGEGSLVPDTRLQNLVFLHMRQEEEPEKHIID